jgi:hypothetical protein
VSLPWAETHPSEANGAGTDRRREREEVDEESQGTRQDPHRMANQPKKETQKTVPKKQEVCLLSSSPLLAIKTEND